MNERTSHAWRIAIALGLSLILIVAGILMQNIAAHMAIAVIIFIVHALATDSAWPKGNRWLMVQSLFCVILQVIAIICTRL